VFKGQTYTGSSFFEFLSSDHPDVLPNFAAVDWTRVTVPHSSRVR
jgi:hypothetical protein